MVPLKIKLPKDFFKDETRCNYTINKYMKEVWAIELDLAVQLLDVCKKHNIQVFADGGTLLGATRHNGFIPWDDDMDFCMLRDEYDKFCQIAPNEFKAPYFFQTAYTDAGCFRGHAQLRNSMTTAFLKEEIGVATFNQGIFIDIFPLDEVSDCEKVFKKQKKKVDFCLKMVWILDGYLYKKNKKNKVKKIISKFIDSIYARDKWYTKYEHALAESNGKDSIYVASLCIHMLNNKWLRKRKAYRSVDYLKFEGIDIPVPIDYDDVLTDLYGDWHKFVQGSSMHKGIYFDTSNSYRKYLDGKLQISEKEI